MSRDANYYKAQHNLGHAYLRLSQKAFQETLRLANPQDSIALDAKRAVEKLANLTDESAETDLSVQIPKANMETASVGVPSELKPAALMVSKPTHSTHRNSSDSPAPEFSSKHADVSSVHPTTTEPSDNEFGFNFK